MKNLLLFLSFTLLPSLLNTACNKRDEVYSFPADLTLEEIGAYDLDKSAIADYIILLKQEASDISPKDRLNQLGNPDENKNLKALSLILDKFNLDQIDITENNEDEEITPRVANWYWKWTGQKHWDIFCWCTKYYCKHRFGNGCSSLGVSWNATGWKTYSQVQCW